MTTEEENILNKYFNDSDNDNDNDNDNDSNGKSNKCFSWKFLGYILLLFILLINPWIDIILEKLPLLIGCEENVFILMAIKICIFVIGFFIIHKYF